MTRLTSWQSGQTQETFVNLNIRYQGPLDQQDAHGWNNFFMGLPSLGWSALQDMHYAQIGSESTGRRWLTAIIQKQWTVAWAIWDYRNKIVNDKITGSDAVQVSNWVSDEYLKGPPDDTLQGFFKQSLQVLLSKSFDAQTAWLHRVQHARERQARRNNAMTTMRANFAAFFGRTEATIQHPTRRMSH
jgi:hypothetical protein